MEPLLIAGDAEEAALQLEEVLRAGIAQTGGALTGLSTTAAPLPRKAGADDHEWAVRVSVGR